MNETLLTIGIALAVPAIALAVIAVESRLTAPMPEDESETFLTLLPNPIPIVPSTTRKATLNSAFKAR